MFSWLMFSYLTNACVWTDKTFEMVPDKNAKIVADARQEIIFQGTNKPPKILSMKKIVKGKPMGDKPQMNVMTGLQVLENGQMKSYSNKVSFKLSAAEIQKTPFQIEMKLQNSEGKEIKLHIEYVGLMKGMGAEAGGCTAPEIKEMK